MGQHIRIVAWLHIAFGLLGVGIGLLGGLLVGGLGIFADNLEEVAVLGIVATAVIGIVILLSVPAIVAGWGLLKAKPWARVLVIIISVLNLFNFPLGTAVGGYSLWVMFNPEAERILRQAHEYQQLGDRY